LGSNFKLAIALVVLVSSSFCVQAAERVYLANGFDMRCDHHAQAGSVVRLYMSPGEKSFIEMKAEDISSYETVPDPPPPRAAEPSPKPTSELKLTQADLRVMLAEAGEQHNLDADLLASVVKAESDGNTHAVSRAGARGLMQLMPGTAAEQGVEDSFSPGQNLRGGSAYLDELLRRYHDNIAMALAAYNAGPAAVDKYHGIPPYRETRAYVARVIHEFNRRVRTRQREAALESQMRQGQIATPGFQASSSR
jgi:soluble lytic murein transglycosylase-like protein